MADSADGFRAGEAECDECGASGARPTEVQYGDVRAETIALCEDCLRDFRIADLIDDVSRPGGDGGSTVD